MDGKQVQRVKDRYRRNASDYDQKERVPEKLRAWAIEKLNLKPGNTVLDLGCGTGLSFPLIEQAIGSDGHIIGVELSPEMLLSARQKIEHFCWENITLIEGNSENVLIPRQVDAVFMYFTPHVTASHSSISRALDALKHGGSIASAGARRADGLKGIPFNVWFQWRYRTWRFIPIRHLISRLFVGDQPYRHLEGLVPNLRRLDYLGGTTYIAWGTKPR